MRGVDCQQRPEYNLLEKDVELKEKQVGAGPVPCFFAGSGSFRLLWIFGGISLNGQTEDVVSFTADGFREDSLFITGVEGRGKIKAMKAEQEMSRLKKEEMSANDAFGDCTGPL